MARIASDPSWTHIPAAGYRGWKIERLHGAITLMKHKHHRAQGPSPLYRFWMDLYGPNMVVINRAMHARIWRGWKNECTPTQRSLWNATASGQQLMNNRGRLITPNGFQLFHEWWYNRWATDFNQVIPRLPGPPSLAADPPSPFIRPALPTLDYFTISPPGYINLYCSPIANQPWGGGWAAIKKARNDGAETYTGNVYRTGAGSWSYAGPTNSEYTVPIDYPLCRYPIGTSLTLRYVFNAYPSWIVSLPGWVTFQSHTQTPNYRPHP